MERRPSDVSTMDRRVNYRNQTADSVGIIWWHCHIFTNDIKTYLSYQGGSDIIMQPGHDIASEEQRTTFESHRLLRLVHSLWLPHFNMNDLRHTWNQEPNTSDWNWVLLGLVRGLLLFHAAFWPALPLCWITIFVKVNSRPLKDYQTTK